MSDEPTGNVSIWIGPLDCWACGCETTIITGIELSLGENSWRLAAADFDSCPDLMESLLTRTPHIAGLGAIKPRHSRTQGRAYLSNGCVHCDALIGQFFEHHAWQRQEVTAVFPMQITNGWREAVRTVLGEELT